MTAHCLRLGGVVFALALVAVAPLPATPPGQDANGDPLPDGALVRLGTTRLRHNDGVTHVVYSPDGQLLASLGRDRTVRVWEAASGRQVHMFHEASVDYFALAWSPNGSTLAAAGGDVHNGRDVSIRFFDMKTGKESNRLEGHSQPAYCLAFSADGTRLVSVSLDLVIRWDTTSGKQLSSWKPHNTAALAVAPDCAKLAWVDAETEDRTVHICNAATGLEVNRLKGHKNAIVSVAWSPDGKFVASGNPFEPVHLWDAYTGTVACRFAFEQQQGGMALRFSADGTTLASAATDGTVRLWEVPTGRELPKLTGYRGWVNNLAFAPDGKTLALAGADSQVIHLWDVALAAERRLAAGHYGQVHAVAYAPDGKLLATAGNDKHANDRAICLWDPATGKEVRRLPSHAAGRVFALHFSPDGKWLASASDKESSFRVWNMATGLEQAKFRLKTAQDDDEAPSRVWALAWSPDGKTLASAHDQGVLILWDFNTGAELRTFKGHEGSIHSLAFSRDGKFLVSGSIDRTVRIWNAATAAEERCIGDLADTARCVSFSPDGLLVAAAVGDYDGSYYLWDASTGREVARLDATKGRIFQFAFSPDGKLLAGSGPDNSLCLWEIATRAERCRFPGHPSGSLAVAFAPDGRTVASGSHDTTALVWNVAHCADQAPPLNERDFDQIWIDLGSNDTKLAQRTICALLADPARAVKLLDQRLRPFGTMNAERMAKALTDLDNDRYQVREKASNDLAKLGELAEPFLRQTLDRPPSLEVRYRVEMLLVRLDGAKLAPDQLRALRAYEVLERIGGAEVRQLFEAQARQMPNGRLGREAQACLDRLATRER